MAVPTSLRVTEEGQGAEGTEASLASPGMAEGGAVRDGDRSLLWTSGALLHTRPCLHGG